MCAVIPIDHTSLQGPLDQKSCALRNCQRMSQVSPLEGESKHASKKLWKLIFSSLSPRAAKIAFITSVTMVIP